jgi:hypothetical protein
MSWQVAELVRNGYVDVKPNNMRRLNMRYPYLEAEVVFAVQQVGHSHPVIQHAF